MFEEREKWIEAQGGTTDIYRKYEMKIMMKKEKQNSLHVCLHSLPVVLRQCMCICAYERALYETLLEMRQDANNFLFFFFSRSLHVHIHKLSFVPLVRVSRRFENKSGDGPNPWAACSKFILYVFLLYEWCMYGRGCKSETSTIRQRIKNSLREHCRQ